MRHHQSDPHSFEDQIAAEKARLEAELSHVPHGLKRDELLKRMRQLETAAHVNEWLSSPGLQPPKSA